MACSLSQVVTLASALEAPVAILERREPAIVRCVCERVARLPGVAVVLTELNELLPFPLHSPAQVFTHEKVSIRTAGSTIITPWFC